MSAEAVGRSMPPVITLDDLVAMNEADEYGHRYETSSEGLLVVLPPPDNGHGFVATELMAWLITAGFPLRQIAQVSGIRIPGRTVDAGRIPDLVLWSKPQPPDVVWNATTDLLVAVEIVSPGSAQNDQLVKVAEYAKAGIPHYWIVARDDAQTVTMFRLGAQDTYETLRQLPLADLLAGSPPDYLC